MLPGPVANPYRAPGLLVSYTRRAGEVDASVLDTQRNPTANNTFAKLETVVARQLRKGFELLRSRRHELQQH